MKTLLLFLLIPQLTFAIQFEQTDDLVEFSGKKLVTNLYDIRDKKLEKKELDLDPWRGYH
jgi:hypothetical protein